MQPSFPKNGDLADLVNNAINMTLTRSILTNLTTFSSILMLYILGVASIKEFTLPMMIGIIAGACSSVFLTGPLWLFMRTHFGKDAEEYRRIRAKAGAAPAAASGGSAVTAASAGTAGAQTAKTGGGNPNVIRKKKTKKHKAH